MSCKGPVVVFSGKRPYIISAAAAKARIARVGPSGTLNKRLSPKRLIALTDKTSVKSSEDKRVDVGVFFIFAKALGRVADV